MISKSSLRFYEVETVLIEVERTLNSRALTYLSEENFADSITPFHLLHGRDINRRNNNVKDFKDISKEEKVRKDYKNLRQILLHINDRFYPEYILALCGRHQNVANDTKTYKNSTDEPAKHYSKRNRRVAALNADIIRRLNK